jgi:hypothetical protein
MKNLKTFEDLFESEDLSDSLVSIEEFARRIGIDPSMIPGISEWWNENRSNIDIHLFNFSSTEPICGVFLGIDTVCINNRDLRMPPHVKMFLALHESRHCDQYREGGFMEGYYDTVINDDLNGFLEAYSMFERDANDYAIRSMREIGFGREMDREEGRLRSNEIAGNMVFRMMKNDINRLNPTDFFDLLKKQIL